MACPAAGNGARGLRGGNGAGESSKRKAILVPRGQNRVWAVAESVRLSDCFRVCDTLSAAVRMQHQLRETLLPQP